MLIFNKKENNKFLQKVEMSIYFAVFIIAIYISGADESYYKFLFLFIIISYTIEYGMKTGIVIASISSGIIFIIDIVFSGNITVNKYFENDLALFAMFLLIAWTLGYYVKLEKSHIKHLTEYANIDGLTGIYNHRYFHECINKMCDDSIKNNKLISLLIIDIDYFKNYNDLYGHKKGDELLVEITTTIKQVLKKTDILCRYGGDEFCIILPDTDKENAIKIADNLRGTVSNFYYEGQEYLPNNNLTISIGLSTLDDQCENYNNLIENADSALYKAKYLRRNKVEVYSSIFERFKELDNKNNLINRLKPLKTLIAVINSRDTYTYNHVERVVDYCYIMANHLKLSKEDKRLLLYGAYLHDLGKINISKEILIADNNLTKEQWEELKRHPQDSANIIQQIDGFENVVPIVLQHHEKYDGSGYPSGLKGENISYLARILTVVDSFDAMTNQRTYQKIKTFNEAFEEIERCKGKHFDPFIATKFIEVMKTL
jgi:diguanylate cyclase (GGDEF)-like protein